MIQNKMFAKTRQDLSEALAHLQTAKRRLLDGLLCHTYRAWVVSRLVHDLLQGETKKRNSYLLLRNMLPALDMQVARRLVHLHAECPDFQTLLNGTTVRDLFGLTGMRVDRTFYGRPPERAKDRAKAAVRGGDAKKSANLVRTFKQWAARLSGVAGAFQGPLDDDQAAALHTALRGLERAAREGAADIEKRPTKKDCYDALDERRREAENDLAEIEKMYEMV